MALPDSYIQKISAIPAYFEGILNAQPPERFSLKFLENLGFTSTNDRLFIGVLKELGFLNGDGVPTPRYFAFLDKDMSRQVVAEGVKQAFSDLFAVNMRAYELSADEAKSKLRTLYAGKKTDLVIGLIAKCFRALCDYSDFTTPIRQDESEGNLEANVSVKDQAKDISPTENKLRKIQLSSLQYSINIILPESRDQAVYDAIFKSLREHLG